MFRNFLKTSQTLLFQQQSSILSAAFVIMAMMLCSKILGLVKLRLVIHYFQDGHVTAAYIAASGLPELFFDILISSVLSVSFIPVFTHLIASNDEAKASRLASSVMNLTLLLYGVLAVLALLFADRLAYLLAPGYANVSDGAAVLALIANLVKLMLLAQFLLIIAGYITAILQSHQRFLVPAIAATLYNVATIIGLVFFHGIFGIYSVVIGMLLGGCIQCLIQIPFLKPTNFKYVFRFAVDEGVTRVAKLSVPRVVGILSGQLVEKLDIALASLLPFASMAIISLDYANRLAVVPVTLFGAAVAQAALPSLTIAWSRNEKQDFTKLFTASFNQILFFVFPVASVLIVLRLPIVRLLFGDPNFTWLTTLATGRTLAMLTLSVVGQSTIMLLARAFYAMQDTKTPLKVSVWTMGIHAVLAYVLIGILKADIWWLAGVISLATALNALALYIILIRRLPDLRLRVAVQTPLKILFCAIVMTITMYIPYRLMDIYVWEHVHHIGPFTLPESLQIFIVDTRYTVNVILLTGVASLLGFAAYIGLAYMLRLQEVAIIEKALHKLPFGKYILSASSEVLEVE